MVLSELLIARMHIALILLRISFCYLLRDVKAAYSGKLEKPDAKKSRLRPGFLFAVRLY